MKFFYSHFHILTSDGGQKMALMHVVLSFHYLDIPAVQSMLSINRSTPTFMPHFDWLDGANTINTFTQLQQLGVYL